jgi:hypothetical protein
MEPEYIERKALDKALTAAAAHDKDKNRRTWAKAICILHDLPAADVAPVVRCENCRYAMWVEWAKKYSCGQVRGLLVFGDHFCAFGKREYESRPQASL